MPTKEGIEARAYEIYLERGSEDGDPLGDWLQAEQELLDAPTPDEAEGLDAPPASPQGSTKRNARLQTK